MRLISQATELQTNSSIIDSSIISLKSSKFENIESLMALCHDIRTPLGAIIGLSRLLAMPNCSEEKRMELAQMLGDSSNMLTSLLNGLLDSSKMEAGMLEIENIDFDPAKIAQEAANIIAVKAAEKNLGLFVHIADGLPSWCVGDPLRIRQIVLNLLTNAVKFTEKGHITLYVNAQCDLNGNAQLCITVTDTGIGISEEACGKIFKKYTQANAGISRQYGGTGLGLSISQDLAHLMGGDIMVKSWPGMGSHFIVTLPMIENAARIAA